MNPADNNDNNNDDRPHPMVRHVIETLNAAGYDGEAVFGVGQGAPKVPNVQELMADIGVSGRELIRGPRPFQSFPYADSTANSGLVAYLRKDPSVDWYGEY